MASGKPRFAAVVMVGGLKHYGGSWQDPRSAAIARDRMRLHYGFTRGKLEYPQESRTLGAASAEVLRSQAAALNKEGYTGVAWLPKLKKWEVTVRLRDLRYALVGYFDDELEAARIRDRVTIHIWGETARLNFPSERAKPLSLELARKHAGHKPRLKDTVSSSDFTGVRHTRSGHWAAFITVARKVYTLGTFDDEEVAARAYDRAVLQLRGPNAKRNFPNEQPEPATPEELRREGRAIWMAGQASRHVGVSWSYTSHAWAVYAPNGVKPRFIGHFDDEEDAALAYDAVVLHYFGTSARGRLNFPDRSTPPRTVEQVRAEIWARFKEETSSEYTGVSWSKAMKKWHAIITVDQITHRLGYHDSQVEAARAYDRAALRLIGPDAWLNFPTGRRTRGSPRSARRVEC